MSYEREINWNTSGKTHTEAHQARRIAELEAEVAALRVDAERYRYLRSQMIDDHFNAAEWERGIDEARKP